MRLQLLLWVISVLPALVEGMGITAHDWTSTLSQLWTGVQSTTGMIISLKDVDSVT